MDQQGFHYYSLFFLFSNNNNKAQFQCGVSGLTPNEDLVNLVELLNAPRLDSEPVAPRISTGVRDANSQPVQATRTPNQASSRVIARTMVDAHAAKRALRLPQPITDGMADMARLIIAVMGQS